MRVLLVAHGYPPYGVAGVERLSEQTAAGLAADGHEVHVLARRASAAPPAPQLQPARVGGIDVTFVAGAGAVLDEYPGQTPAMERIFERTLLAFEPDAVLMAHTLFQSPGDVLAAQRWGVPAVVELHDFFYACPLVHLQRPSGELCAGPEGGVACARACFPSQSGATERWTARADAFLRSLRAADAVVVPSSYLASWFADYGGPDIRIDVIPNGVPFEPAPRPRIPRTAGLRLATLGALVPHKGPHRVIEAVRAAGLADVRYTLLGPPTQPYVGRLRALEAATPGLELRLDGPYHPSDLPAILAAVDVVVVPSEVPETFSIVAREALACGVPVLAPRSGALPEAVRDGENGLLFENDDPASLTRALTRLAEEPGLLDRLRAGIGPGDWLSGRERTQRLTAVLADVVERDRLTAAV